MEQKIKERIDERLSKLDSCLLSLKKMTPSTYEKYRDSNEGVKWDLERGLQLVSEIEVNIIVLLSKALQKGPVGEESSLIMSVSKELGEGVIKEIKERRKLRNELVHAYTIDNDEHVFDQAADTSDVDGFKQSLRKLLEKLR